MHQTKRSAFASARSIEEPLRQIVENAGIVDPAKVTRLALQNAASVAGLLLTTEVMIAEAPKEDDHAHGAPGGGRGGIGGMDM